MKVIQADRYAWKRGAVGVKASVAAAEFHRIAERDGDVSPAAVVEAATPKGAPLHPAFEWNDKVAATAYREDQARNLLRKLVVVYTDAGGEKQETRAMVRLMVHDVSEDDVEDEPFTPVRYLPVQRVLADEDLTRDYVAQARTDLKVFQEKYKQIVALTSTVEAVAVIERQLAKAS